ncbi:MAG: hypothetical protein CSA03_01950 [Bacteroidetes bacterium]|nr:MAG: hypothetical protein CSA03_01950 [Bacteroidota bacterium]
MVTQELTLLNSKLHSNGRVNLYRKDYFDRMKWVSPVALITASLTLTSLFYFDLIGKMTLVISSIVCLLLFLSYQLILKRARIAALKGDTIILKGLDDHSTVTSIKSVKQARSFQILGIQVTRLSYIVDKKQRSSLVFGSPAGLQTATATLIQHAKKWEKHAQPQMG